VLSEVASEPLPGPNADGWARDRDATCNRSTAPAVHRSNYRISHGERGRNWAARPHSARSRPPQRVPLRLRSVYGLVSGMFPPNRLPAPASAVASWFSSTHLPLRGQRRIGFLETAPDFPFHPSAG
jgi:hypothetical protein